MLKTERYETILRREYADRALKLNIDDDDARFSIMPWGKERKSDRG